MSLPAAKITGETRKNIAYKEHTTYKLITSRNLTSLAAIDEAANSVITSRDVTASCNGGERKYGHH